MFCMKCVLCINISSPEAKNMDISLIGWNHLGPLIVKNIMRPHHRNMEGLVILTIYYLTAQGKHGPVNSSMINWSPLVLSWTSVWSLILIMINTIADVFDLIECSCEFLNWLLVKPHSIFIHARPCKIQSDFKGFQNTVIWNYETFLNKWQYDDDCVTDRIVK